VKKIALFVEGQTDAIFISEMIRHIFGENKSDVIVQNMQSTYNKLQIDTFITSANKQYYFLICDCGADDNVKSKIKDDYQKLLQAGFVYIIGLQDLYNPQRRKRGINDNMFRNNINNDLLQIIPTRIFFAIQEIEAWFIAEETHYKRISSTLTMEVVNSIAGIDIEKEDTEKIPHPAVVLGKIYLAGGRKHGYSKNQFVVKDIVYKLDFYNLYINVRNRNESLNDFLTCMDGLIL